ncbi:MAG: ATP-binding protein [Burkholderiales bacterium]|nr:ATP-binding protein [Burkholderiales bacterium]
MNEPVPAEHRPLPRRLWLVMVVAALVVVLLAVAYVQWRQYRLLDNTTQYQNDGLGWSFSQLETEHLRLRNEMQKALDESLPFDAEAVQLRYDIFVSRIGLVDHARAQRVMLEEPIYGPALARVQAFVLEADHFLGDQPEQPLSRTVVVRLLPQLDALSVPLHDLALSASHLLYERATLRNSAVRKHSQLGFALTLFQALLLLVLGVVVLRQLRALTTRRRSLEAIADSLRAARLEAESANRAKSAFLANMSHEIRTPFHGMLGMMSLLQEARLTPQQAGFLQTARESAQHLLAILNDILDISQLETGKLQVMPEPVDLLQLINEVGALMRVQAQAKGLSMRVAISPEVPRWVQADATRVKQILFNLLSNAVKFSNSGNVELAVSVTPSGGLEFKVTDTGIGMDDATVALLFQRFMRADESTSRRHGGTGLGLEISRDLARVMGGDITVRSSPGVGSSFTVSLPLETAQPLVAPALAPVHALQAAPDAPPAAPRRLRVLVAEDHPVNRAYLEAVLDKLGHEAVFSEDGDGAVRAIQAQPFDVVLMDLHMPGMDGFAAARAIRAMPGPRGRVPIVALTADAFREARDRAREAGMDGFLTKPAHLPQLRDVLARYGGATGADTAPEPRGEQPGRLDFATIDDLRRALSPEQTTTLLLRFFEDCARASGAAPETDGAALRARAHSIKGAALSLGLSSVAALAEELQRCPDDAPAEQFTQLRLALEADIAATREQCVLGGYLPH